MHTFMAAADKLPGYCVHCFDKQMKYIMQLTIEAFSSCAKHFAECYLYMSLSVSSTTIRFCCKLYTCIGIC